jgi:hypothetical protein
MKTPDPNDIAKDQGSAGLRDRIDGAPSLKVVDISAKMQGGSGNFAYDEVGKRVGRPGTTPLRHQPFDG